tara:strand:+ start:289 stop:498 length:210 start_codon:yes stop_codon:yes gene_type:complete
LYNINYKEENMSNYDEILVTIIKKIKEDRLNTKELQDQVTNLAYRLDKSEYALNKIIRAIHTMKEGNNV